MDSQFFNRKRFIALCRWDWTERQKALGLQTVVIYAVLTVFSGFYTIRGALRANALSHYVSPQRVEEWKAISADLAQGVDGSWTSVSVLFSRFLPSTLSALHAGHKRALQATSQATRTLTFPVSTFEQFLLRWLYAVPLALLTYCAVFVAADFTRVGALQPHRPASGLCPPAAIRRVLEWQSTPILVTYHTQPDALGAVRFHLHLRNETGRRAHRRPPARRPRAFRPRTFALRPGRSLQPLAHPPRYCECLLPAVHRPQLVHGLPPYPQNRPHLCQIRQTLSL